MLAGGIANVFTGGETAVVLAGGIANVFTGGETAVVLAGGITNAFAELYLGIRSLKKPGGSYCCGANISGGTN